MRETKFIKSNIQLTCERNNVSELCNKIQYQFVHKIQNAFSQCYVKAMLIEFSQALWDKATLDQKKNAVVHETAHIVTFYKYGKVNDNHGREWVKCVERAGETAHVLYCAENENLPVVGCLCKKRTIERAELDELKNNVYICKGCGTAVRVLSS